MVHTNIKTLQRQHGFTIVELLIVIVVIGILATITIVSYAGVTLRAHEAQAQTNGETAQKVAESYNADNGYYPPTAAAFATGSLSTHLPAAETVAPDASIEVATASTYTSAPNTVYYSCTVSGCATPAGGRITYWDPYTKAVVPIYLGTATSASTFYYPAS